MNHINLVQCCTNSPVLGGKHQAASKFCRVHSDLECQSLPVSIPLASLRADSPIQPTQLGSVPDSDSTELLTGCRKGKNVNTFHDRTAGVIAAVRPCGIIVNFTEMFTCESPTQMYIFLAFTFCHQSDISRLRFIAYDRACDLHPFLTNVSRKGAHLANYLLKHTKYLVDRFHVKGHTESCCKPPLNNPACKYHPDLPVFSEISGANTECAEQCFRWLNKHKTVVRNMKQYRFNFFLYTMIDLHNQHIERSLAKQRLL